MSSRKAKQKLADLPCSPTTVLQHEVQRAVECLGHYICWAQQLIQSFKTQPLTHGFIAQECKTASKALHVVLESTEKI